MYSSGSALHNHLSASNFDSHVQAYIDTELSWNAIAGPFEYPPFSNDFVCSPLQTVPKRGSSTWRVVMDLSFPSGCSVNDGIPQDTYMYLANIISYNYPGLTGLSNSSLRERSSLSCFQEKLAQSLSSVSHWFEGLPFTRFLLSGQILFWHVALLVYIPWQDTEYMGGLESMKEAKSYAKSNFSLLSAL